MLKVLAQTCLVFVLSSGPAAAQHPSSRVTIGVLNDQSGIYADVGGMGSIWAARMAVEDFGGTVLGRDIAIVAADHGSRVRPSAAVQTISTTAIAV